MRCTCSPLPVSIHALLAECDSLSERPPAWAWRFNPRTPCGVRHANREYVGLTKTFQSTHSLRSATNRKAGACRVQKVSIHALLAECDDVAIEGYGSTFVSIHALLAECDWPSRKPVEVHEVSIHALLAECDVPCVFFSSSTSVSIHALLAECDGIGNGAGGLSPEFQSTHSLRSATALEDLDMINVWVSIHALLAECDAASSGRAASIRCFNPRTPCGVRHADFVVER